MVRGPPMSMKIVVTIIAIVVAFEIIEHVIVPLIFAIFARKRRSVSGAAGMIGKTAQVKRWGRAGGYVSIRGEEWRAVSNEPLATGDKVTIEAVDGLTLRVSPMTKG
jgi:membrane-bound serine protease (ClpP class)